VTAPSNVPPVQPGTVTRPVTSLEQRVAALERQLAEYQRKDLKNAVVGQGGTFRATLQAGGIDVLRIGPGQPEFGSKQVMRLNDMQGHPTYQHDELAGYGLSAPGLSFPMIRTATGSGFFNAIAGTETNIAQAGTFFYNPCQNVAGTIYPLTTRNGATFSVSNYSYRLSATDGTTTIFSTSSTVSGAFVMGKMVLLPADFINKQNVTVNLLITATANDFFFFDGASYGGSKSLYDINPSAH
jgi:hypothetical protein